MALILTIPEPGKGKRIKDTIIDILSFEWPLTLTKLFNKVNNAEKSFTYQAVFKAANELIKEKVLFKNGKEYSIDQDWLEKLKQFAEHILHNYQKKAKIPLLEGILRTKNENNVTIMTFNSLLELDKTWMKIKTNYYQNIQNKKDITVWEGEHCWWLLVYPEAEYDEMEKIKDKKVRHCMICHSNSALDKFAKKFYDESKIPYVYSNSKSECDSAIFGDTIMQVYLPDEIKKEINNIYEKHHNLSEIDLPKFIKLVLKKRVKINLILIKNKEIADQLKNKALNELKMLLLKNN